MLCLHSKIPIAICYHSYMASMYIVHYAYTFYIEFLLDLKKLYFE